MRGASPRDLHDLETGIMLWRNRRTLVRARSQADRCHPLIVRAAAAQLRARRSPPRPRSRCRSSSRSPPLPRPARATRRDHRGHAARRDLRRARRRWPARDLRGLAARARRSARRVHRAPARPECATKKLAAGLGEQPRALLRPARAAPDAVPDLRARVRRASCTNSPATRPCAVRSPRCPHDPVIEAASAT